MKPKTEASKLELLLAASKGPPSSFQKYFCYLIVFCVFILLIVVNTLVNNSLISLQNGLLANAILGAMAGFALMYTAVLETLAHNYKYIDVKKVESRLAKIKNEKM